VVSRSYRCSDDSCGDFRACLGGTSLVCITTGR
jgi:hypothetical protein